MKPLAKLLAVFLWLALTVILLLEALQGSVGDTVAVLAFWLALAIIVLALRRDPWKGHILSVGDEKYTIANSSRTSLRVKGVDLEAGAAVIYKGRVHNITYPLVVGDAAGDETEDEHWSALNDVARPHRKRGQVRL